MPLKSTICFFYLHLFFALFTVYLPGIFPLCPAWQRLQRLQSSLRPPVISHSHRSSAAVTCPQPQSSVISHSHQSSASVTGHQPQSQVIAEQLRAHIVAFALLYTQFLTDFHRWSTSGRPCLLLLWRWNIISPLLGCQLLSNFRSWTPSSQQLQRRSFSRWRKTVLYGGQTVPVGHLFIW